MLGRLARYLRFVGCDTLYVRGLSDDELISRAEAEGRLVVTRDRLLSRRVPGALLLVSPLLPEQWRAVRSAWPWVPTEPTFVRCSECNGSLVPAAPPAGPVQPELPPDVRAGRSPLYACSACGHLYWGGSHTARVRRDIARWEQGEPP